MKTLFSSLLLSVLLAMQAGPAAAETTLAGKWQGWLEVQPGRTMAIQFVITTAPGGGYTALVTSPDNGGIKDVKAESVKFADNKLSMTVPALSGGYARPHPSGNALRSGLRLGQTGGSFGPDPIDNNHEALIPAWPSMRLLSLDRSWAERAGVRAVQPGSRRGIQSPS